MRTAAFLVAATTVAACVAPTASPAPSYRATGTEPFWSLAIEQSSLTFTAPDIQSISQHRPRPIVGFAGEIYQTPRIRVNIVHVKCSDGMSDRIYPDKVQVDVDERRYEGCGGL